MFLALLRKEILNNLLNLRFILSYFLCTILLVGSAAIMLADYAAQKKVYDTNRNVYERTIDNNIDDYWGSYMGYEKPVARPPIATKIFAAGVEKDPDPKASVAYPLWPYFNGDFKRNPLSNLFPTMDAMFIIGIILSLLIFVLTYDSISGEREEGTLKVLLSCPVPRDLVITAKWAGGYLSLFFPYIVAWLIVALLITFSPGLGFGSSEWLHMLMVILAGALYIAVIFSISMAVSVVARNSGIAILALLFIWVVLIVALPALSTPAAYLALHPPAVEQTRLDIAMAGYPMSNEIGQKMDAFLKGRSYDQLSDQEKQEFGKMFPPELNLSPLNIVDNINGIGKNLTRIELNVDRLSRAIGRFSPYGCFQNMCINFAGTGIDREIDLRTSLENFTHTGTDEYYKYQAQRTADSDFYRGSMAPRFKPSMSPASAAVTHSLPDAAILLCMGIAAFMIAFLGFLRMEII